MKSGMWSVKQQGDEKTPEESQARLLEVNRLRMRQQRVLESQDDKVARLERGKIARTGNMMMLQTVVNEWLESLEYV